MHFYESSIITTIDGLHCQVYGNEHPVSGILVKPKYIPTEKIHSDSLPYRFISGRKMNRLDLWAEKEPLRRYIKEFKKHYPDYVYKSSMHRPSPLLFAIPISKIERVYFPKKGLSELMSMPISSLDEHLKIVHEFVKFLLGSGLRTEDFGVTYSTLMGHYLSSVSDINIVVYGKKNYWKLMAYLEKARHGKLRWKNEGEWMEFHKRRNRFRIFAKKKFLECFTRKRSEGYFGNTLFVIFGAENEQETWFKWDAQSYRQLGEATIEATVEDDFSSVVRPGCYAVSNSRMIEGPKEAKGCDVTLVVFYSRDYSMMARPKEKIRANGIIEEVTHKDGSKGHRIVVGYFDSYISDRREKEFITVISDE